MPAGSPARRRQARIVGAGRRIGEVAGEVLREARRPGSPWGDAEVLRLSKIRSGGGDYYLEVAEGTGTGIEAAGRWVASGIPSWRLSGDVTAAPLQAVLAGRDPASDALLGARRPQVRVAGFDLTFCAPKSVSLLHALGDPGVTEAVTAAHRRSVEAALSYVERHALAVRRRTPVADRAVPVPVEAVTAAGFAHRVSRALDPHLHTHVVVANLGRGPEGSWSALDGRGLYAHASAVDGLYHVQLRHELTRRLGVAWELPVRGRADIVGIPVEARRAFSRRATAIAAHLAERGLSGGGAATVAGHVTRQERDLWTGAETLRGQWRARALEVGIGPRRLDAVLHRVVGRGVEEAPGLADGVCPRPVLDGLEALRRSVTRRDVVRSWCRALPGGAPASSVEEAADRLLDELRPERGRRGAWQGPGVAERRLEFGRSRERPLEPRDRRAATEGRERRALLERRGIGLDRSLTAERDPGRGLG